MYRVPLQQLKLNYTVSTTNKKVYTEEEDRFLLVMLDKFGLDKEGVYDQIRDEIRESPLFRFDWFFLSRTPQEISRRCTTLITTVAKEMEGGNGKENKRVVEDDESEEVEEPSVAETIMLIGDGLYSYAALPGELDRPEAGGDMVGLLRQVEVLKAAAKAQIAAANA